MSWRLVATCLNPNMALRNSRIQAAALCLVTLKRLSMMTSFRNESFAVEGGMDVTLTSTQGSIVICQSHISLASRDYT
jgi:hypothetical protein